MAIYGDEDSDWRIGKAQFYPGSVITPSKSVSLSKSYNIDLGVYDTHSTDHMKTGNSVVLPDEAPNEQKRYLLKEAIYKAVERMYEEIDINFRD